MKAVHRALALLVATLTMSVGVASLAQPTSADSANVTVLPDDTTTKGSWSFTQDLPAGGTVRTYNRGSFAYALPNSTGQFEYEVGGDLTSQPSLDEVGGMGFGDNGYTGQRASYRVHGPSGPSSPQALESPDGSQRRPTACFGSPSASISLPLAAGNYRVAVYLLDYDRNGRIQTTVASDAGSSAALTTVWAAEGVYVVYNVHTDGTRPISLTSTIDAGPNAVISGVFVDPLGSATSGVSAVGADTTTQGSWRGRYGSTGYVLCGFNGTTGAVSAWSPALDASSGLAGYAVTGQVYAWANAFANTTTIGPAYAWAWGPFESQLAGDPRAATFWKYNATVGGPAVAGDRRATTWDSGDDMLPSTSGARPLIADVMAPTNSSSEYCKFDVSFYFFDRDGNRSQQLLLQEIAGTTVTTADSRSMTSFGEGVYYRYRVSPGTALRLTLTRTAGVNAILNGIFWDEVPCSGGGTSGGGAAANTPGTPGYWGNWANHYSESAFAALLADASTRSQVFSGITVKTATDMLRASAKTMSDKMRQHLLALQLNLASQKLQGGAVINLALVNGAASLLGPDETITVNEYLRKVNAAWGGDNWAVWSRSQLETAKAVADAVNNFGNGSLDDIGILVA